MRGAGRPLDLSLYLVADVASCAAAGVAATVGAAVRGGVGAVQLRDPHASGRQLYELAVELVAQLAGSPAAFFVDDRLDVARAAGADGVHLGQHDLPAEAARAAAGPDLLIGWSVTDPDEAAAAGRFPEGTLDYLGVGPVFPTTTKRDAAAPIGVAGLAAICHSSALPCIAIGGIDVATVGPVLEAGASGIAVVAAICGAPDPRAASLRLRAEIDGVRARRQCRGREADAFTRSRPER
ncbi:MAG TPA: thiamine phosphate synthase [Acidimicrobiales bacterium]|nr:thiamine phosphate synthase [Acidimicrobiales bacterium]